MTKKELMDMIKEVGTSLSPKELAELENKMLMCKATVREQVETKKRLINFLAKGTLVSTHDFTYTNAEGTKGKIRIHAAGLLPDERSIYWRQCYKGTSIHISLYNYHLDEYLFIRGFYSYEAYVHCHRYTKLPGFIKPAIIIDGLLSGNINQGETFNICGTDFLLIGKYLAVTCNPIVENLKMSKVTQGVSKFNYSDTNVKEIIDNWYLKLIEEDNKHECDT